MSEITRILSQMEAGEVGASERLLPLVYDELKRLAAARMARERAQVTLQATALVHEAYLRLLDGTPQAGWNGRGHFFGAAALAMRRILVEQARRRGSQKRGGGRLREDLSSEIVARAPHPDLLALDEALTRFAALDPAGAQLVGLRYFTGLTNREAAEAMGISPRKADQLWAYARAWLRTELESAS